MCVKCSDLRLNWIQNGRCGIQKSGRIMRYKIVFRSYTCCLQTAEMKPVMNAMDARAQLLLSILNAFAQRTRSLYATRNAWYFHSVCSSRTVSLSYHKCPVVTLIASSPSHRTRHAHHPAVIISWPLVCIYHYVFNLQPVPVAARSKE